MRTGQELQGSNRFLGLNLNTFCYFFLSSTKEKSMSGESTCNRCSSILMDPNNNTIHVIYLVLYSTNPNKAVEYEATIAILFRKFSATNSY